jgi:hypothetical protein
MDKSLDFIAVLYNTNIHGYNTMVHKSRMPEECGTGIQPEVIHVCAVQTNGGPLPPLLDEFPKNCHKFF